jgi:hypothetical protein
MIGEGISIARRLAMSLIQREDDLAAGDREAGDPPPDAHTTAQDMLEGLVGAAGMALALATPFLRRYRGHWGLTEEDAARTWPGDELVPAPRWSWTHGIEIDALASDVWPWIAQIGADRGGFYSYQALENLVGCELANADEVRPEWALREGDTLSLHPKMPPFRVVSAIPGHGFVAFAPADPRARAAGKPWSAASWAFVVEPIGNGRCRFVSRFRCACSDDLATRLAVGPAIIEPIGFVMDRKMLLGVKERAEHAAH